MQDFRRHPALRRSALAIASVVTAGRGMSYLESPDTGSLTTFVDKAMPLGWWAWVWIGVAAAIMAGILSRNLSRYAMSLGASLWTVWGISFMWAWVAGDAGRGYLTGLTLLGVGGFMWIIAALIEDMPTNGKSQPLPILGGES